MKVILTADVYKHGVAGEIIEVADGFARNWLLPQNLAKKASPGALKQLENLRVQAAQRKMELDERLNQLARQIDGVQLVFGRKASPTGKLFGSVTTGEIAAELNRVTGIDINRRRISQTALRELGTHDVPVRLGSEISPSLKVVIVREGQVDAYLSSQNAPAEGDGVAVGDGVGVGDDMEPDREPGDEGAVVGGNVGDTPLDQVNAGAENDVNPDDNASGLGATESPETNPA